MPNEPGPWAVGKHTGTFTATGLVENADGSYSLATGAGAQSLIGLWDEWDIEMDPETEEISSSDAGRRHVIILKEGSRVRLVQITRRQKAAGEAANVKANPMAYLCANYDGLKFVFAQGLDTWEVYTRRGRFVSQHRKGRTTSVFNGLELDPGLVNPSYTSTG